MTDPRSSLPRAHPSADHDGRIRPAKLLSAEQERELAGRAALGDDEARNRLVRLNLGLVFTIARGYLGRGLEMEDLAGEGNLGLIRAVQGFDPRFGVRFSTYAAHWIKQAIRHALINTTATIRLPTHMVTLLSKWRKAKWALTGELGQAPTFDQVAVTLGLSDAQCGMVEQALRAGRLARDAGVDEGWSHDRAGDHGEESGAAVERAEAAGGLRGRMAARLDEREREIIALRFGLDDGQSLTLKEVGRRLGLCREWIRKVERRSIAKLRHGGQPGD